MKSKQKSFVRLMAHPCAISLTGGIHAAFAQANLGNLELNKD